MKHRRNAVSGKLKPTSLVDFPQGAQLTVLKLAHELTPELRSHLSAWGLMPGARLTILGQRPLTRLTVEHAELALEHDVAAQVHAEIARSSQ